ncbi:hypothetical protein T439DRAFT_327398 [Meredithblackwellia eburnea MCA 4105]
MQGIESLPFELLIEIFNHLFQEDLLSACLVCHRWKQYAQAAIYSTFFVRGDQHGLDQARLASPAQKRMPIVARSVMFTAFGGLGDIFPYLKGVVNLRVPPALEAPLTLPVLSGKIFCICSWVVETYNLIILLDLKTLEMWLPQATNGPPNPLPFQLSCLILRTWNKPKPEDAQFILSSAQTLRILEILTDPHSGPKFDELLDFVPAQFAHTLVHLILQPPTIHTWLGHLAKFSALRILQIVRPTNELLIALGSLNPFSPAMSTLILGRKGLFALRLRTKLEMWHRLTTMKAAITGRGYSHVRRLIMWDLPEGLCEVDEWDELSTGTEPGQTERVNLRHASRDLEHVCGGLGISFHLGQYVHEQRGF